MFFAYFFEVVATLNTANGPPIVQDNPYTYIDTKILEMGEKKHKEAKKKWKTKQEILEKHPHHHSETEGRGTDHHGPSVALLKTGSKPGLKKSSIPSHIG